jgi:signal transduction histidine kinase
MEKFLLKVISQGTNADYLDHRNRRIIYTNIIYFSLPVVYLTFVLIDIKSFLVPIQDLAWDQFIFLVEIVVCLLGIYMNKLGLSLIGRLVFLLTWPFLLHIIPIWHQHSPIDYYLAFPIAIIFHAVLIQLMFSIRYERLFFWPFMIANFLLLMSAPILLTFFADSSTTGLTEFVSDTYYLLDSILYWLLFSLVTFSLVRAIDNLFDQVGRDQLIIEDQKEELAAMNEELVQSNESLQDLNNKISGWNENLEETVKRRTREIEEQNTKLKEYAFYNAHKLRGPFCRIKGLVMLRELVAEEGEKKYIESLIDQSIRELELVIDEIQEIVTEKSGLNREKLPVREE